MLSPRVVKEFRRKKLESYRWMKRLTRRELMYMINDLGVAPEFISPKKPWKHQLVSFLIGVYAEKFLFFLDMGLGKTRVILELVAYWKRCGKSCRALAVVPNSANIENWVMEVEEHRPDLSVVPMYGSSKERFLLLEQEADLFIINYAGLVRLCTDLKVKGGSRGGAAGKSFVINSRKLKLLASKFDLICLDETTEIMNHRSLTYRLCRRLSKDFDFRFGMAGIPTGRDPQALWSQFNFCDHGETLGETLAIFRQAYFKAKENYWSGYPEWKFNKKNARRLNIRIQNRSIHYDESECRDMPKRVYKPIYVPFSPEMEVYYNRVVEKLKKREKKRSFRMVKNSFLNMRQLASGFIGLIDDETGERAKIEFAENPKRDAMSQAVREIPKGRKVLIYHEYTWTGEMIGAELERIGVPYLCLRGGQKNQPSIFREFRNNPKYPAMVVNNHCGAFGLNMQVANYEIFVESPVSPIIRGQAEKRVARGGQKRKRCFIIDIIMRGNSADENIQKFLEEGQNVERALMRGDVKLR